MAVHSDNCMGTVRRAISKLVDVCQGIEKQLCVEGQDDYLICYFKEDNWENLFMFQPFILCFTETNKMNQYAGKFSVKLVINLSFYFVFFLLLI